MEEEPLPACKEAPKPQVTLTVVPKFWAIGPNEDDGAGCGQAATVSVYWTKGKGPDMQAEPEIPALTNEELIYCL